MATEQLQLKWGTLKGWKLNNGGPAFAKLQEFSRLSDGRGAMMEDMTDAKRELLCEIIDALDAETVYLEWDGRDVTKDEAKSYVMDYRV